MSPPAHTSGGPQSPADEHHSAGEDDRLQEASDLERILEFEPSAVSSLVAVLTEPVATLEQIDEETVSPLALRAVVTGLVERQRAEREAFFAALAAYKELTERLALDVSDARHELAAEADRGGSNVNNWSRISWTGSMCSQPRFRHPPLASPANSQRRTPCFSRNRTASWPTPSLAATAQSVIDDMRASNSWRLTSARSGSSRRSFGSNLLSPLASSEVHLAASPDHFDHNVSVIILNYNQGGTTVECLEALRRADSELISDIIVVDNGSVEAEVAILREHNRGNRFTLVEVGENRYFSEGNNIGVDHTSSDYIVFLNNDAFVHPGWIETLAATMEEDPSVAAVGPMFLYPDGRVQEVGGVALATGDVVQIGKGTVWGPEHFDTPCAVDFCSAACLMMRRADFLRVGGFGFEWEPAYYEDTDLCLKLWTSCGKVMVNPAAESSTLRARRHPTEGCSFRTSRRSTGLRFADEMGTLARRAPDAAPRRAHLAARGPKLGRRAELGLLRLRQRTLHDVFTAVRAVFALPARCRGAVSG